MAAANGRSPKGPRCVALVGPYQSGKTTLLESILHRCGAIPRQGKLSDKNTIGDASSEARAHAMGTELNAATAQYMGESFTFLDCPGSIEFAQDARDALPGCDAAVVVCEADEKKAPALQLILKQLEELRLPHFIFINKVDKSNSRPHEALSWLQSASAIPLVMRELPIVKNGAVAGYVDLALERAFIYHEHAPAEAVDIPSDLGPQEKEAHFALLERLADHDDKMMEELLSDHEPTREHVMQDLARESADGLITPVFFGSAEHGNGIGRLLKALRHEVPGVEQTAARLGVTPGGATALVLKTAHSERGGKLSLTRVLAGEIADGAVVYGGGPEARVAGVFALLGQQQNKQAKAVAGDTVALGRLEGIATGETLSTAKGRTAQLTRPVRPAGVFGKAISVHDRKDEVKLTQGLAKLVEEDPSLRVDHSEATHELVLWGQGEIHLKVALERMKSKFGLEAATAPRKIAYKETIRRPMQIRGRHKKQSGGHGQYGDVIVEIKPLSRGEGFAFSDSVVGGTVPKQYIPAVEAGIVEWKARGPLGFEVVDFAVNLSDGSYHDVDSSEMAFKMAARLAMSEAMPQCQPLLLEPVAAVEIHAPSEHTARINQIVTGHRGQLLGFDGRDGWPGWDTVKAHMPEAEIASLIVELRSATSGVGTFTFAHDHMAELTGRAAEQVVAAAQQNGKG
ncbi:MAG: elongation factor G [Alphaproteobacteria bacterium]|nr:elongation factor G [Alphaproteobacteria bacterium]